MESKVSSIIHYGKSAPGEIVHKILELVLEKHSVISNELVTAINSSTTLDCLKVVFPPNPDIRQFETLTAMCEKFMLIRNLNIQELVLVNIPMGTAATLCLAAAIISNFRIKRMYLKAACRDSLPIDKALLEANRKAFEMSLPRMQHLEHLTIDGYDEWDYIIEAMKASKLKSLCLLEKYHPYTALIISIKLYNFIVHHQHIEKLDVCGLFTERPITSPSVDEFMQCCIQSTSLKEVVVGPVCYQTATTILKVKIVDGRWKFNNGMSLTVDFPEEVFDNKEALNGFNHLTKVMNFKLQDSKGVDLSEKFVELEKRLENTPPAKRRRPVLIGSSIENYN